MAAVSFLAGYPERPYLSDVLLANSGANIVYVFDCVTHARYRPDPGA
jgi:hypothetical protein